MHIRCMGSRRGSTISSQVYRLKSVGSISCSGYGCDAVHDNSNIFYQVKYSCVHYLIVAQEKEVIC